MNRNALTAIVVLAGLVIFAFFYYQYTVREDTPGQNRYRLANKHLEDGEYNEALTVFNEVLSQYPEYKDAHLGKALTLMQMKRLDEARGAFDRSLELDSNFALAYANRGILYDRTGHYPEALSDYSKAIELNPKLAEGPGWLWRFLRNIPEKPPTIADRAEYLEAELQKPGEERLLRVPEIDAQQRMYKK